MTVAAHMEKADTADKLFSGCRVITDDGGSIRKRLPVYF